MFNREINDKFKLKTDRLPAMMGKVYQDGTYIMQANKTNVRLSHTGDHAGSFLTMTWDEQLQLSVILDILDGTVFALCNEPGCDCNGIMLNFALFDDTEGAIKMAGNYDESLVVSGDEEMCYIVCDDESQISICWVCAYRLKEFMSQVDSLFRGGK